MNNKVLKAALTYMRNPEVRRLTYTIQDGEHEIGHYNDGLYKWSDADIDALANGTAGVIPAFERMVTVYEKMQKEQGD
jgi:hypothetical protein